MCGIAGIFDPAGAVAGLRPRALDMARHLRHRGPDWSGIWVGERALLVHERLAIVGVDSGAQPLVSTDEHVVLAVNGEIYNHAELRERHAPDVPCRTGSDCEILLELYRELGPDFAKELNGIFAFVLYDVEPDRYVIGRDPIGVIPLYLGRDREGRLHVASEMKALLPHCESVEDFPPGHILDSEVGEPQRYFDPEWRQATVVEGDSVSAEDLRTALDGAVRRQLMSDVPYGLLLSGGLDSSVVAACAVRHARGRVEDDERSEAWWPRVHSFAIGLEGSPDLAASQVVADALGTVHHPFTYTIEQGLDALRDVIRQLETFDITTIRAATPMYLMARRIKAMGVKMVLSGEGSDEMFGGYLYFHKAPHAEAFHGETVRKLEQLHKFDCLRANKSMAAWGVEARVPFLDLEFLETAMRVATRDKMIGPGRMEKHLLREAFRGWLPDDVLWRQKEQFSDGVGYGWIDTLQEVAEQRVTDTQMKHAAERYPAATPWSKEGYFYRSMFEKLFPHRSAVRCVPEGKSIACSSPVALEWDRAFRANADPSGRAVHDVHEQGRERAEGEPGAISSD